MRRAKVPTVVVNWSGAVSLALELGFLRRYVKPSTTVLDLAREPGDAIAYLASYPASTPKRYAALRPLDFPWTWVDKRGAKARDAFDVVLCDEKTKPAAAHERLAPGGVALLRVDGKRAPALQERLQHDRRLVIIDRFGVGEVDVASLKERLPKRQLSYLDPELVAAVAAIDHPEIAPRQVLVCVARDDAPKAEAPSPPKAKRERTASPSRGSSTKPPNAKGQTCGERIRELLKERGVVKRAATGAKGLTAEDVTTILAVVKKEFPWSKATRSDIGYQLAKIRGVR